MRIRMVEKLWKEDIVDIPDDLASDLISKGLAVPIEDKLEEELILWGIDNINQKDKDLIKFACDEFGGTIVDVEKHS